MVSTVAHVNGSVAHAVKRTVANSPRRRQSRATRVYLYQAVRLPKSSSQVGTQQKPARSYCEPNPSIAANSSEKGVLPHSILKNRCRVKFDPINQSNVLISYPSDSCVASLEKKDHAVAADAAPRANIGLCAGKASRACLNNASAVASAHEGLHSSEHVAKPASSRTRRVHFDDSATVVHEVEPYAEIYGLHPRLFDFDRNSDMIPIAFFGKYFSL